MTEDGRYKVTLMLSVTATSGIRYTAQSAVRIDGTTTRQYVDSAYIRNSSGSQESAIVLQDVMDLTATQYIEIVVARISTPVTNATTTANRTKLIIEKIG